jgi:hypothetical protein
MIVFICLHRNYSRALIDCMCRCDLAKRAMFHRSCPRMGMRFASGNVYYMNQMFSARHLQSVASPLSTGFITPVRFMSGVSVASATSIALGSTGDLGQAEATALLRGDGAGLDVVPQFAMAAMFPFMTPSVAFCAQSISGLQSLLNISNVVRST